MGCAPPSSTRNKLLPCYSDMETNESAHLARRVLIGRIETLAIGRTDAALSFDGRLAAKNGWSEDFATRVAVEYRRFLALIATSDDQLTPSDAVDQAWHLHLTFTRHYWHDLCRDTIGRDIHHEPTSGGYEQREHYRARYAHTLERYYETFGNLPPQDVWPAPEDRFERRFVRVEITEEPGLAVAKWTAIGAGMMAVMVIADQHVLVAVVLAMIAFAGLCRSFGKFRRTDWDGLEWDLFAFDGAGSGDCGDAGGDGGCGGGCGGGCS